MQTLLNVVQDEEQAIIDECSRMISEIIDGSQGNEQKDYITLGIDEYGEPIKLFDAERLTHFACIGKSGTGKSKHAESMIEQDIDRHKAAVILLDPHGALAKDIIRRCALKSGLRKRLVSFDPSEFNAYVAGYNDLKPCFDEAPSITANRKTYDIKKVFDQSEETQVLVEQMLNNALMCLIVNGKSILDLELFFDINNTDVILEMAGKVGGPVFTFWQNYAHLPLRQKEERIAVLQRRAERFIHNPVIRQCLGEKHRVLDFRDIIENKKILVINLSTAKRKISDQDARLLGTMFLSDILAYGLTREDDKQAQDNPVHIYIDEFPWFISGNNSDLERIINGGRKYGLGLHLFCQQISQLKSDDVREAFLNANTQVVFRVGYETADVQAKNLAQFDLLTPKYIDEKVRFEPNLELRTVSNTGKSDNSGTKVSYDSDGEPLYSMNYGGSRSASTSETWVNNPIKKVDYSPRFYALGEHFYMFASSLQNLSNRRAFVKIGNQPVIQMRTKDMETSRVTDSQVQDFLQLVYWSHACYSPTGISRKRLENRHEKTRPTKNKNCLFNT